MKQLFADGSVIDLIFVFMALEAVALIGYRKMSGMGLGTFDVLGLMLPGLFLLWALKKALIGASWWIIAAFLLASLVAHLGDLWRRQKA
jgi:hypothetical protein